MLVFEPGTLQLDEDLIENTGKGLETLVKMGTSIGHASDLPRPDEGQPDR